MKTLLEQKLTQKALNFRFGHDAAFLDHLLSDEEVAKKNKYKNVCAMLSEPLTNRLENTLGLLSMTKREFLELAIIEALDKADAVMADCGVDDYLEELSAATKGEAA